MSIKPARIPGSNFAKYGPQKSNGWETLAVSVTSQEADFDEDLDFDRFGMTGFFEAVTPKTALRMSSSFIGFNEIGLALAISYRKLLGLTKSSYNSHIRSSQLLPPAGKRGRRF